MNRLLLTTLLGTAVLSAAPGTGSAGTDGVNMIILEQPRRLDAAVANASSASGVIKRKAEEVRISTWPLIVPKELLKVVPAGERAEFLASLVLVNGAVAEMQNGILRKYFKGADFKSTLYSMHSGLNDEDLYYHEEPSKYARLDTLLKDVPVEVRREFLDNLAFENGHLVSAYIGGLRKRLSPQNLGMLLNQLACDSRKTPPVADTNAVCGAGWCTDSNCPAAKDIPGLHPGNIACFSSCLLSH